MLIAIVNFNQYHKHMNFAAWRYIDRRWLAVMYMAQYCQEIEDDTISSRAAKHTIAVSS